MRPRRETFIQGDIQERIVLRWTRCLSPGLEIRVHVWAYVRFNLHGGPCPDLLKSQSTPCRAVEPIVMASIFAQHGAGMTLAFDNLPLTGLAMGGNGATRQGGVGGCPGHGV